MSNSIQFDSRNSQFGFWRVGQSKLVVRNLHRSTIETRHSSFQRRVQPKELRNLRLVVRQVLVERPARGHAGLLPLDDHRGKVRSAKYEFRDSVSSTIETRRSAFPPRARDAELADKQEIIVRWMLSINHPHPLGLPPAALAVRQVDMNGKTVQNSVELLSLVAQIQSRIRDVCPRKSLAALHTRTARPAMAFAAFVARPCLREIDA